MAAKSKKPRAPRPPPEPAADGKTLSGTPVKLLYDPRDVDGLGYDRDLGFPGDPPFTRVIAEPATVSTEKGEPAPEARTAPTDSPTELEGPDSGMVATVDAAPPQSWRRTDDDILYRPSRRRRSPRRAWRDRVMSRF